MAVPGYEAAQLTSNPSLFQHLKFPTSTNMYTLTTTFRKLLVVLLLTVPYRLLGQSLTQKSSGSGAILFPGSQITVDLGEAEASVGYNNLNNAADKTNPIWPLALPSIIVGGAFSGKSEEGIAGLLSDGDISPAARGNVFFGFHWTNGKASDAPTARQRLQRVQKRVNLQAQNKSLYLAPSNTSALDRTQDTLASQLRHLPTHTRSERFADVQYRLMVFGYGGFQAQQFKRYFPQRDTVVLAKNFDDVNFRGRQYGIGVNAQYWRLIVGLRWSLFAEFNNFDALTKRDYTLTETYESGNQKLVRERKLTAYNGEYGSVNGSRLDLDVVYNLPLDDSSKQHLLINPYLRQRKPEAKTLVSDPTRLLLPETLDMGCGFYFYKREGKFLGGIYAELPDVDNNIERNKPLEDQNLRKPWKRLTVGIVTTFSITSLLDTF